MNRAKPGRVKRTKEQRHAAEFLELHGIVHFLLTEQRCPVIFNGQLAYVKCPGVSKEAFKQAIDKRVAGNLLHWLDHALGVPKKDLET